MASLLRTEGAPDDDTDYADVTASAGKAKAKPSSYIPLHARKRAGTFAERLMAMHPLRRSLLARAHPDAVRRMPKVLGKEAAEAWLREAEAEVEPVM
jgi:hypothetical protein